VYNRKAVPTVATAMPAAATPITKVPLLVLPEADDGGAGSVIGLSHEKIVMCLVVIMSNEASGPAIRATVPCYIHRPHRPYCHVAYYVSRLSGMPMITPRFISDDPQGFQYKACLSFAIYRGFTTPLLLFAKSSLTYLRPLRLDSETPEWRNGTLAHTPAHVYFQHNRF
jgi:hypothetical protein